MDKDNQEVDETSKKSQEEICEVKVELPIESVSKLSQLAAAEGVSLEELVADQVAKLVK